MLEAGRKSVSITNPGNGLKSCSPEAKVVGGRASTTYGHISLEYVIHDNHSNKNINVILVKVLLVTIISFPCYKQTQIQILSHYTTRVQPSCLFRHPVVESSVTITRCSLLLGTAHTRSYPFTIELLRVPIC